MCPSGTFSDIIYTGRAPDTGLYLMGINFLTQNEYHKNDMRDNEKLHGVILEVPT